MIIEAIDNYLAIRPKGTRASRCFHPSSLHRSAEDLFRLYFEGDDSEEFEPRVLRIFDNGHAVHERLQSYLGAAGVLLQAEVPIYNAEFEIVGHTDGIVEVGGSKGILEIKSINSQGFYGLFGPKPEHIIQLNAYMFCTGIPRGVLLYECKNDQSLKEFFLKLDHSVLDPVLQKIRTVQARISAERKEKARRGNLFDFPRAYVDGTLSGCESQLK